MTKIIDCTLTVRNNGEIVLFWNGEEFEHQRFDKTQLKHIIQGLNFLKRKEYNKREDFIYFGSLLYNTLIKPVESRFKVSWREDIVKSQQEPSKSYLRLKIVFEEFDNPTNVVSQIINLPWEFLCYEDDNNRFLGTDSRIGISYHYQNWLNNLIDDSPIKEERLQVLFIHAHPKNLPVGFEERVSKKIVNLTEKVELTNLANPTTEELREAIKKQPHVLHFLGHGKPGELALRNPETGEALWFPDQSLSDLIYTSGIKLVVLQACESAASSVEFSFSGTASQVVKSHIPAVVAFRYPIEQPFAWHFIETLYTSISEGKPLDFAVQAGREALANNSHSSRDFGAPVLWMRFKNGILIEPPIKNNSINFGKTTVNSISQAQKSKSHSANPYYIERPLIEQRCYEAIEQTAALLRIKAPKQMGKRMLMERILSYGRKKNYKTVILSFDLIPTHFFDDLDIFLKWFCVNVGKSLDLINRIEDYWDDIFGGISNSTDYFQQYLLVEFGNPVILGLDKVDLVFEHPMISNDFCRLLRGWNDLAKRSDDIGKIWNKLRLIILHSTEVYSSLKIHSSPLAGVGTVVELPDFTLDQIQNLVQNYGFTWTNTEIAQFTSIVGGHPYLITQGLEYIKYQNTLEEFLKVASTESGPFNNHLRELLSNLRNSPELADAYYRVITQNKPIFLESKYLFKLHSMGLIKIQGDKCLSRYKLYSQYFSSQLKDVL